MKHLLLALSVAAAVVAPRLPAANAACIHVGPPPEVHQAECTGIPQSILDAQHVGGCGFASATDAVAGEGQMTGEIHIEAVVFSASPADNPVSATFTCYIKVNGATQPGAVVTASGTLVVVGGGVVTYTSSDVADFVQLCQDVSYSNGVNTSECFEADEVVVGPAVQELLGPMVCPLPDQPGIPGVWEIWDGDLLILGDVFFDCPPYYYGYSRWPIIRYIVP